MYFGQQILQTNAIIREQPSTIDSERCLQQVLSIIHKAKLCPGSTEDHFVQLLEKWGDKKYNQSGELIAFIDNKLGHSRTVRTANCELICCQHLQHCTCCSKYQTNLSVQRSRQKKNMSTSYTIHSSHVNYRFLTEDQKDERLRSLESAKRLHVQKNARLHQIIFNEIKKNGLTLHPHDSEDIASLTYDISEVVTRSFHVGSVQRIFWEQQIKYNMVSKEQMRWHPYMIRFALNLKYASTAAYRAVQRSGVIALPSERTLRDYTHWISIKDGPQSEVLRHIQKSINLSEEATPDSEVYFALSMDEMKIRSGLFFRKHTGELVGFTNLGEANENLERLVENLNGGTSISDRLAEEVLVFMLRHISKPSTYFPVAMYPSACLSGEKLYPVVFEVVEALELHGFPIISITSDGNSPNRKFYRMCSLDTPPPTYKTPNPYAMAKSRDIYFFCDPPHLLKTTRNNFANSYSHANTRRLWVSS